MSKHHLGAATGRLSEITYAALRIVSGALFSVHGMQKIFGWFGSAHRPAVGTQIWWGGVIELVAGLLIALGLFTRPAAFLAAGTMAVAYFQFHFKLVFTGWKWLPVINQGELAVMYCFVFLYIATRGSGIAALGTWRRRG